MEYKANNEHFWVLIGSIFFYVVGFPILGLYLAYEDYKNLGIATESLTLSEIKQQYGYRYVLIFLSLAVHSIYLVMFIFWDNIYFGGLL
jgi:hypothetical protein